MLHIFHCTCAKRPYFHFRSNIWRHHSVPRPRFPLQSGNFGVSRTFKADIGSLIFVWIFRISWPTMAIWGQNRVRVGWCDIDLQQTRFFTFGGSCVYAICKSMWQELAQEALVTLLGELYLAPYFSCCGVLWQRTVQGDSSALLVFGTVASVGCGL